MGGSFSKGKNNSNVTLLRTNSGGSSCETANSSSTPPPKSRVLAIDPRSPAEEFTRTPITVSEKENCSSAQQACPVVTVVDPRSPSQQLTRTPILVEATNSDNETCRHRTSDRAKTSSVLPQTSATSHDMQSNLKTNHHNKGQALSICTDSNDEGNSSEEDPRSPTTDVPRTPLDEHFVGSDPIDGITRRLLFNQSGCELDTSLTDKAETEKVSVVDCTSNETDNKQNASSLKNIEKEDAGSVLKIASQRKPLNSVQASNRAGTPRAMLQAKQCRTLEEEFSKNQQNILNQLAAASDDVENVAPVPTQTQFIAEI